MKTVGITISFIVWCLITLILSISIIGLIVFIREDNECRNWQGEEGESAWFKMGRKLINKLTE
jgi:hypothetical protein